MPQVDNLFNQLQGAGVWSKIDLRSGCHQLSSISEYVTKTTLRTIYGSWWIHCDAFWHNQ